MTWKKMRNDVAHEKFFNGYTYTSYACNCGFIQRGYVGIWYIIIYIYILLLCISYYIVIADSAVNSSKSFLAVLPFSELLYRFPTKRISNIMSSRRLPCPIYIQWTNIGLINQWYSIGTVYENKIGTNFMESCPRAVLRIFRLVNRNETS